MSVSDYSDYELFITISTSFPTRVKLLQSSTRKIVKPLDTPSKLPIPSLQLH